MFRSVRYWLIPAAIACCGALAGPVAVAQASDATIANTFATANTKLNNDEGKVASAINAYKSTGRAAPVVKALRHEVGDIRTLNQKIKSESASSATGRTAKADITNGLSMIGNAYATLATDIQKARAGNPVPKSTVNATVNSDKKGRAKVIKGLKLLGFKVKT